MSNFIVNDEVPLAEKMNRESGNKTYPIWLLVNPKHVTVLDKIWAPVLTVIQDKVYREKQARIDAKRFYIRNAVEDCEIIPNYNLNWFDVSIASEIENFRETVLTNKPKILITFGAFPFEFSRRVLGIKPDKGYRAWSNYCLEAEFRKSIENFDVNKINLIPLLRRVLTDNKEPLEKGYYNWKDSENYIRYVGIKLAERLIDIKDSLDIWIN